LFRCRNGERREGDGGATAEAAVCLDDGKGIAGTTNKTEAFAGCRGGVTPEGSRRLEPETEWRRLEPEAAGSTGEADAERSEGDNMLWQEFGEEVAEEYEEEEHDDATDIIGEKEGLEAAEKAGDSAGKTPGDREPSRTGDREPAGITGKLAASNEGDPPAEELSEGKRWARGRTSPGPSHQFRSRAASKALASLSALDFCSRARVIMRMSCSSP